MKMTISRIWTDPDDSMMEFKISIETADFKGTAAIYGYQDTFNEFADKLLRFPFETRDPIIFEGGHSVDEPTLRIKVSLHSQIGAIGLDAQLHDEMGSGTTFSGLSIETQALHDFAKKVKSTDFSAKNTLAWEA